MEVTTSTASTPTVVDPAVVAAATPGAAPAAVPEVVDPTEQRVLRLDNARQALRREKQEQRETLSAGETKRKADALVKEGKYVEALETLGLDADEFYLKASDQIHARTKKDKDPAEIARETTERTLREQEETRAAEATKSLHQRWTAETKGILFEKGTVEYPDVAKAIVAGRFSHDDILRYGEARAAQGLPSDAEATLKALQAGLAPKAAEPTTSAAPPAALISNAPPSKPEDWDALPLEEALAKAKAKFSQPRK
jgi:hypothetical protein